MTKVTGTIKPLRDNVIVTDMNFEEQKTASGIVILSDDGKVEGVKPRWGKVWAIGPEQTDVKVGEWILIEHGRWTRGIQVQDAAGKEITIRWAETKAIMAVANERPNDLTLGSFTMPANGSVHTPSDFINV